MLSSSSPLQSSSLVRFVRETRAVRHFDIARGIDRQLTTQQQVRPRPFPAEIMSAHPRVIDRRRVPGSTSHKSHRAFRALQRSGNFPWTLRTWPPDTPALSLPPPTQAFTRWPNTSATSARPSRVRARCIPSPRVARRPLIVRANNDENEPRIPSRDPPMRARPAHPPTRPFITHSADVLTGGLSYDNKFNISSKATDDLVRLHPARAFTPSPDEPFKSHVSPTHYSTHF